MEDAWHKLKLGKGVTFVKGQLRRLPQAEDTWAVALDPVLDNDADPDGDAIAIASDRVVAFVSSNTNPP